jgi:hypothetical protein
MGAFGSSAIIILTSPSENLSNQRHYSPEELSKRQIEVKKDPLPEEWKRPRFLRPTDEKSQQKAAINVIYNEMLSRIETLSGIPSTLPPETVTLDAKEYLSEIYGTPDNAPSLVYRMACLGIVNTRVDFQRFCKGSPKKMEAIVYQVIAEFYDLGKPPITLTVSSAEDYFRKHKIKGRKKKTDPKK